MMRHPADAYEGSEVWFVTGSLDLYGQETLNDVERQSRAIAHELSLTMVNGLTLVWKPVVIDAESIRRTLLDAESSDRVVGVIVWMHTFSPAKMWISGLSHLQKPLLHLHTQSNRDLPWGSIDFDFMNLNQSAHGDREFAYIAARMAVRQKIVVGHVSNPRVTAEVQTWCRAAVGHAAIRALKLARFGDNMRYVAVTEGDKTEAEIRFGVQVNTWGVNELADAVAAAATSDVDVLLAEYDELYSLSPELREGGDRRESLRDAARIELGLRSFLVEGGFGAFTTDFEDLGDLPQLPGLAVQRLTADGYGFGAEGDWKTAILVRLANVMGQGLPGGASLMEDYTYHLEPGNELILGSHMLEVSHSLTTTQPRLEVHPLSIGGKPDPVRLVFTADPGPALVVAMSDMRDRFRLVANVVENVPLPEPMPHLPVGHALWRPTPDLATSAGAWLEAGAAHHTVMTSAVGVEAFRDYAEMVGVELLVIDESTTLASFRETMRANASYYRMAQGL